MPNLLRLLGGVEKAGTAAAEAEAAAARGLAAGEVPSIARSSSFVDLTSALVGKTAEERSGISKKLAQFAIDDELGLRLPSRFGSSKPMNFKVPRPAGDTAYTDEQMGALATPNRIRSSPLFALHDVSLFSNENQRIFAGRFKMGQYEDNERHFLRGMERQFNLGNIDAETLVVSHLGHGPTVAYAMAHRFRSDIFMHLPRNVFDAAPDDLMGQIVKNGNHMRVLEQGQTFFKGTADAVNAGAREKSSALLSLEAHQTVPVSRGFVNALPSADDLRAIGIKKVFVASESYPYAFGPKQFSGMSSSEFRPVSQWLSNIRNSGIPVLEDGVDMRRLTWRGRNALIP